MLALSQSSSSRATAPIIVPVVPERGMIDPSVDRILTELALHADRTDPALRNALYIAYAPRLRRILMRLWYRNLAEFGCELCDLEQELFLIFAVILERWSGKGSLSAYLHGTIPWRLYDAARRLAPRDHSLQARSITALEEDSAFAAAEAEMLLQEIADRLLPFERAVLLRHVRHGESLGQIARAFGMSPRTIQRVWAGLEHQLRRTLTSDDRAPIR